MTARKPLRRTAWSLFLGGLFLLGVLIGAGILAAGQDVAPGRAVTWQAGQTIALLRPLGPNSPTASSITCTAADRRLPISESITTTQTTTITCDHSVTLATGTTRVVAQTARSPLIVLPIAMVIAGAFLFFPRFSLMLARMGVPFRRRPLP